MADDATGLEPPISPDDVRAGILIAACSSAACGAATIIDPRTLPHVAVAERLEDAIRCTCGSRSGRLRFVVEAPPSNGLERCYVFHS
jgi:hypothetical protein